MTPGQLSQLVQFVLTNEMFLVDKIIYVKSNSLNQVIIYTGSEDDHIGLD